MGDGAVVEAKRRAGSSVWPWAILLLTVLPAIWHVVYFPNELDPEFPKVDRPTFSKMPPPAYRLAEPGDTLDRVAMYMAAAGVAISLVGLIRSRRETTLWPTSLVLCLAALWHASTPGPTFDGWHGLGFRAIFDGNTPAWERVLIALGAFGAATVVALNLRAWFKSSRSNGETWVSSNRGLLLAAFVLVAARQFEIPGVEPVGYWPRWAQIWGLLAFDLALFRSLGMQGFPRFRARMGWTTLAAGAWLVLVVVGVKVSWFHRPLERLHEVEPGKVYISAMPTYPGLQVAQSRHQFKTIINLFPEDTDQRSSRLPDEHRFVRENGIKYIEASASDNHSDEFLDLCLATVQDPANLPVLIHCHGCMDRSPGWMGVYRFIVQGRPLDSILKEIEAHRGYRPKASITLLFNRVLEARAPERYQADPTAALLQKNAHGIKITPYVPPKARKLTQAGEPPVRP